jgi:hypothetical protein
MNKYSTAWREAMRVFLLSRLLFISVTLVTIFLLPRFIPSLTQRLQDATTYELHPSPLKILLYSWLRWDAGPFLNISGLGYKNIADAAFFPFWPLVQHVGGLLLGGSFPISFYIAGLLLANLFFYLALVFLYSLLAKDFDAILARRALFCLTFSPYALFFFAGYSEPFFLLFCCAFFLLLRRGTALDMWLAGIIGFLAVLTRSSGIALVVPFLVVSVQRFWLTEKPLYDNLWQKLRMLAPVLLIPIGVLVYMFYLYLTTGNPLIFSAQEKMIWDRQLTLPLITLVMAVQAIFRFPPPLYLLLNIVDLIVITFSLLTLGFGWKHLPWHYRLFALTLVTFILSFPVHTIEPLMSQSRYMLSVFPIFIIIAYWNKKPIVYRTYMVVAPSFLVINVVLFVANIWVS